MKSLRVVLMSAIVMMAGLLVQAQTADEIAAKHVAAIGGKDALKAVKSVYIEYDMEIQGNVGTGVSQLVTGKGFRNEIDFGGMKLIQVFTDKGGWGMNQFIGQTAPEPLPEDELKGNKGALSAGGPLVDYANLGAKLESLGTENVGGVNAHKLKLTIPDGPTITYWIDPATWYVSKQVVTRTVQGQSMDITTTFSDYKKNEAGFVTAGAAETEMPQISFVIRPKKTEYNKEIDPKVFEMGN